MFFRPGRPSVLVMALLLSAHVISAFAGETERGGVVSGHLKVPQPFGSGTVSIQYDVVPMGGNLYRYVYTITNNGTLGATTPLKTFDILFDTSLYQESSLQIVTPANLNLDWDQKFELAVPGLPPLYDALALNGGLPVGKTVSGFAVQFVWLGSGTPGPQPFEIYDPTTYNLLQSGQTVAIAGVPAVSTLMLCLLCLGLALTAIWQMRGNSIALKR